LISGKDASIRPDISIWNKDSVLAIIECKTQLGWNRGGWMTAIAKRQSQLVSLSPNAKMFYVVMTTRNWSGFGDDERVGKYLFTLYNVWPTEVNLKSDSSQYINNPIEPLIKSIIRG